MKKKIVAFLLVLTMAVCVFPMSAFADDPKIPLGTVGYINQTGARLRGAANASTNSNIIGLLENNDKFWYQGYGGEASGHEWYYVFMGSGNWSGTSGYVARTCVKWSR